MSKYHNDSKNNINDYAVINSEDEQFEIALNPSTLNVSIATIPPRIRNGDIYNAIDGFLNQTLEVNKIFINLPFKFNRFDDLNEEELNKLKNYNKKVQLTFTDYDSPILKYLGCIPHLKDDDLIFVGDDDQVYKEDLLEKMTYGFYNDECVFQNRYHQVKTGTAGIIHGFVGLMMKKKVLNKLNNFNLPSKLWIDDQLMSIYLYKNNISILPSPIHNFDDIYHKDYLNQQGMEQIGDGALCKMDLPRKKQIRELEIKYNVFFLYKENIKGKGEIIDVDWNKIQKNINIHFVVLDNLTASIKHNVDTLLKLYPNFNFNFWNNKEFQTQYPKVKLYNSYLINYYSDQLGLTKIRNKEGHHIYINRNFLINKDFDIYEYILNTDDIYFDENNINLIKNTYKNNFL